MKYVGRVNLKNFLVLLLQDPHHLTTKKKDTSVTFWAERKKLCHTYDTSMMIIVTKLGIIIDGVGSYFYDTKWAFRPGRAGDTAARHSLGRP